MVKEKHVGVDRKKGLHRCGYVTPNMRCPFQLFALFCDRSTLSYLELSWGTETITSLAYFGTFSESKSSFSDTLKQHSTAHSLPTKYKRKRKKQCMHVCSKYQRREARAKPQIPLCLFFQILTEPIHIFPILVFSSSHVPCFFPSHLISPFLVSRDLLDPIAVSCSEVKFYCA
jgi:hypothetical protein